MYTTGEYFFPQILETDGRPHQNNLDEYEDLFLFIYARMLLHKCLRKERMLSPYANPFHPIIETSQIKMEIKTETAQKTRNIDKPNSSSKIRVNIDNKKSKDKRAPTEDEWTDVKHEVKSVPPHKDIRAILSDYYKVLWEIENKGKE